jgi:hypothetical protein
MKQFGSPKISQAPTVPTLFWAFETQETIVISKMSWLTHLFNSLLNFLRLSKCAAYSCFRQPFLNVSFSRLKTGMITGNLLIIVAENH